MAVYVVMLVLHLALGRPLHRRLVVLVLVDLMLLRIVYHLSHWNLAREGLDLVFLVTDKGLAVGEVVEATHGRDLGLHAPLVARLLVILAQNIQGTQLVVDLRDLLPKI